MISSFTPGQLPRHYSKYIISTMNDIVVDSPSVHHQSSFRRHQDPPERIQGPVGPVEENARRRICFIITFNQDLNFNEDNFLLF